MLPRSGRQEDAGGRGCDQRGHADNRRDPPETGPEAHPEPALLADGLAHGGQLRRGGRAGGRALTLGPHRRRQLFEDGLIFWRHPGVGRHRSTSGRYPSWVGPKCPIRPARWNGRGRSSQRAEIKSERTSPPTVSDAERNPLGGFVKVISSARPPPRPLRPSGGQASTASGSWRAPSFLSPSRPLDQRSKWRRVTGLGPGSPSRCGSRRRSLLFMKTIEGSEEGLRDRSEAPTRGDAPGGTWLPVPCERGALPVESRPRTCPGFSTRQ